MEAPLLVYRKNFKNAFPSCKYITCQTPKHAEFPTKIQIKMINGVLLITDNIGRVFKKLVHLKNFNWLLFGFYPESIFGDNRSFIPDNNIRSFL